MNSKDNLAYNWDSDCKEAGHSLPENLYDNEGSEQNFFGGSQNDDGSIKFHGILLVKEEIEHTLIKIPETAVIRIFFRSIEINRAKIEILKDLESTKNLAFTDGKLNSESFIVRLKKRVAPYVIRITHNNLKSSCTKYELKVFFYFNLDCYKTYRINF